LELFCINISLLLNLLNLLFIITFHVIHIFFHFLHQHLVIKHFEIRFVELNHQTLFQHLVLLQLELDAVLPVQLGVQQVVEIPIPLPDDLSQIIRIILILWRRLRLTIFPLDILCLMLLKLDLDQLLLLPPLPPFLIVELVFVSQDLLGCIIHIPLLESSLSFIGLVPPPFLQELLRLLSWLCPGLLLSLPLLPPLMSLNLILNFLVILNRIFQSVHLI
jgi:hypothetical protein